MNDASNNGPDVLEAARRVTADMARAVSEPPRDVEEELRAALATDDHIRNSVYADALMVVARQRKRNGFDPIHWTPHAAETARDIARLLKDHVAAAQAAPETS